MTRNLFSLALALSVLPIPALAQSSGAPPQLTDQQKQAMHATFARYGAQQEQLRQQMRYDVLSALTPAHRRELASLIGQLAIEPNPDLQDAAARIDRALSSYERQRIVAAQQSFEVQRRQLRAQMRSELQSELPARPNGDKGPGSGPPRQHPQLSTGMIVLMTLTPHPPMGEHGGPEMMHP